MNKRNIIFILIVFISYFCGIWIGTQMANPIYIYKNNEVTIDTISVKDSIIFVNKSETPPFDFATYPYSVSEVGKQHIKEYESLRLEPYYIGKNPRPSIGYGHQILDNENYTKITEAQANKIFDNDIQKVNASINRLLSKVNKNFKFSQGFIDGLGSLIYNCGEYGVSTTVFYERLQKCRHDNTTVHNINQSDFDFTLAAVKTTKITYEGHKKRRIAEYKMMIN